MRHSRFTKTRKKLLVAVKSRNKIPHNKLPPTMCGIVAWLTTNSTYAQSHKTEIISVLLEGLQRLEYRGYDSAGIALMEENTSTHTHSLRITKKTGKVNVLREACGMDLKGERQGPFYIVAGLAHTRWATHGAPSDVNAHPHTSNDGMLAVVHNGIIENYAVLRMHLQAQGYEFKSQTDTEVLAHLIRHVQTLEPELELENVVALALTQVTGAFGICVLDAKEPNKMVGARRGSPLLLGVGENGLCLASDAAALVGRVAKVIYLEDEDMVVCIRDDLKKNASECYEIRSLLHKEHVSPRNASAGAAGGFSESESESKMENGHSSSSPKRSRLDAGIARAATKKQNVYSEKVERDLHKLELSLEKIEKGGYRHFMMKEIMEQPRVLKDCMRGRIVRDETTKLLTPHLGGLLDKMDRIKGAKRIIITACGTSWHSALVAEHMIESLAKIPVEVEYASEFRYRNPIIYKEDVVCAISQSGETADTLEAIRIAKSKGALALGFVNVVGSSIARLTDAGAYLHIGPEIGVASTKAFCGQVTIMALFAIQLGLSNGSLTPEQADGHLQSMQSVPDSIEHFLRPENVAFIEDTAKSYRYAQNFLFLGRGPNHPVALEGALKLKEISYIHAEGYPAAELKHGPIALIDRLMPVVIIAPRFDPTYEKVKSAVEEVVARSGSVIVITDEDNHELDNYAEVVLRVPMVNEFVSPLITCIPLQLLAYYIANFRGCAIDQPRNLAKSVTVE